MNTVAELEYWLRGPVEGVPPLLQPVAHALLQSLQEVTQAVEGLPPEQLWSRPGGVASVGFHLRHLPGMLERLFAYARGEALSEDQLRRLAEEGEPAEAATAGQLVAAYRQQVEQCLAQLRTTRESELTDPRYVGRKRLPSNVLGLLFHGAEHAQRHTGQLIVTGRVLATPDA